ncbi:GDP-fucose protein O-fucosyltransferase 1-like, partial [Stegodyphus dumicola]|uniref:GDP-fucose protein O-fucosyltransferase 1-like n=1 Tax=Stegodyphus dumicola TaxID=202533 RepID=UPI0015B10344
FCYSARGEGNSCNAKDGNPFGPFWDTFDVDFDDSVFYQPLHYDVHHHNIGIKWNEKFPPDKYPVLAFTGAPATFPVQDVNRDLQQYLIWSDTILKKAKDFIMTMEPKGPFVGIHLRNGADWVRACQHIEHSPLLFAAPQCLGYRNEFGHATQELCFPSKETILMQLRRVVKALRARSVFVASDNDHMIKDIEKHLKDLKVKAYKLPDSEPHTDLAILGLSNHFIGNCISSFSAFAKRERDVNNLQSSFWAFPLSKNVNDDKKFSVNHDEF